MVLHQTCLSDWIIRSVCLSVLILLLRSTAVRSFYRTLPPRPNGGALVFFTDPDIIDPPGDDNQSSLVGAVPFARQAAGETEVTLEEVDIVSVLKLS